LRIDSPPELPALRLPQPEALFLALLRDASDEQLQALQWRDCGIKDFLLTDELAPLLSRLPFLMHLQVDLAHCTRFDFLAALPRLTSLDMRLWSANSDPDWWRSLLTVFTSDRLTRLRTLSLSGCRGLCTRDGLLELLSHTPSLTSLVLHSVSVDSLSFFRQLPKLAQSLTDLTVSWLWMTAADLPPLLELQQLRSLRLLNWPDTLANRLTAADRAPFEQRPCHVLPYLEVFEWTVPR
jgi:hypothetical protein